jgi:hypothetical protein
MLTSKVGCSESSAKVLIIVLASLSFSGDASRSRVRFALNKKSIRVEEKLIISARLWKKSMTGM